MTLLLNLHSKVQITPKTSTVTNQFERSENRKTWENLRNKIRRLLEDSQTLLKITKAYPKICQRLPKITEAHTKISEVISKISKHSRR